MDARQNSSTLDTWLKNKIPLKLGIMDYVEGYIWVLHIDDKYFMGHRSVFKQRSGKPLDARTFNEKLYSFIWTPKISDLIVRLHLARSRGQSPSIYELNKYLRRTPSQYTATYKVVKKLEALEIVRLEPAKEKGRGRKRVYIRDDIVCLYGDEEFRQMMLDEWNGRAKTYILNKRAELQRQRDKIMEEMKQIDKGKRPARKGWHGQGDNSKHGE